MSDYVIRNITGLFVLVMTSSNVPLTDSGCLITVGSGILQKVRSRLSPRLKSFLFFATPAVLFLGCDTRQACQSRNSALNVLKSGWFPSVHVHWCPVLLYVISNTTMNSKDCGCVMIILIFVLRHPTSRIIPKLHVVV